MKEDNIFEVIIIGGSYAGLSAAMALGRSLRKVLIIDTNKPCNRQTPRSHNFITLDGKTPKEISTLARQQVEKYKTVSFYNDLAITGTKTKNGYNISTLSNKTFSAKKIIFATGIKDVMPNILGFAECWGVSIIHCPYCHGYEVRNEKTGILGNGDYGFEFSKMINNLTKDLTLFTNGKSTLTIEQTKKLTDHNIKIIETEIDRFEQENGYLKNILFKNGTKHSIKAVYSQVSFIQHSDIPEKLGCKLTEQGYIEVDAFQKTNIYGVYACGDNTTFIRSVANAVYAGNISGAMVNKELVEEKFK
ncbi:NAD(P)/FAD-dependent oxidoreductase [Aquimarina sp. MMG016]|uniref:NAD(P)/FAD-dependent oxidoreductase n=1 Tax=Aquimarina sp. MMG016 TaxID=2822690 RepID=UPI001B3A0CEC|nr:NAD(P)/FAD-dependent oxidoreductase [Aquimarina sp. MMG016]MBQ4822282.1 NAD(P)/FAD-dependent oxidoreductase [Aquimarina sp. MMG016]